MLRRSLLGLLQLQCVRRCKQRLYDGVRKIKADVAQLVEHSLGKGEVISSILIIGSRVWNGEW